MWIKLESSQFFGDFVSIGYFLFVYVYMLHMIFYIFLQNVCILTNVVKTVCQPIFVLLFIIESTHLLINQRLIKAMKKISRHW